MFDIEAAITRLAVSFVPLLLGVICHEVAHGYVALLQGDRTAQAAGRLTMNPIPHLDPAGSMVFILTALFSPFVIGWAKPVPVDFRYFRNVRKGMVLVSLAGPGANIALAFVWALLLKLGVTYHASLGSMAQFLLPMFQAGVVINLILAIFNLIPIPPMDGSKVLAGVLPPRAAMQYMAIERYGFIIVILLLATGLLWRIIGPVLQFGYAGLLILFNIPIS